MNRVVLAVIVITFVVALFFGRTTVSRIDRLTVSWPVAWLKTAVIVVGIIALVGVLPAWVMTLEAFANLDRVAQDLVGSAVFGAGLLGSLWLLSRAQKDSRI